MIEGTCFGYILVEAGEATTLGILSVNEGANVTLLDEDLVVLGDFFEGLEQCHHWHTVAQAWDRIQGLVHLVEVPLDQLLKVTAKEVVLGVPVLCIIAYLDAGKALLLALLDGFEHL